MVNYIKGDLFTTTDLTVAHGCNALGVMGSGVAKIVRDKWPIVFDTYHARYRNVGLKLGQVIPVEVFAEDNHQLLHLVCNCITQQSCGSDGKQYCDYEAIETSMRDTARYATTYTPVKQFGRPSISLPKIGAGLGGGDWTTIEAILNKISDEENVTFNVWVLE